MLRPDVLSVRVIDIMIISAPRRVSMLELSSDVDDSKIDVSSKTVSIIKDISVGFDTSIIDEVHMFYDNTSDDVDEIIESNKPSILPSKSFELSCAEYSFMVIPIDSSSSESPELLAMIQQMFSSVSSFTGHLEFILESSLSLPEFDVCHPKHPISLILLSLGVMLRVPIAL